MTTPPFPTDADGLTPAFMGALLGLSAPSVVATEIGQEQSFTGGRLYRLDVISGQGTRSVVAKFSPIDPARRADFARANGREVEFYRRFGDRCPVPKPIFCQTDATSGASLLILDHASEATAVRFTKGCDGDAAAQVVDALAVLHGAFWGAPDIRDLSGADLYADHRFPEVWASYPQALERLLPGRDVPASVTALGSLLATEGADLFRAAFETGPSTLLHRDIHSDNLLFGNHKGVRDVTFLDWQMVGRGRGGTDLGYFLISSLTPEVRRRIENDLVARYHDGLTAAGVTGYGLTEICRDLRLGVVGKGFLTISATVLADNGSAAKTAWRATDLERLDAFLCDHDLTPERLRDLARRS